MNDQTDTPYGKNYEPYFDETKGRWNFREKSYETKKTLAARITDYLGKGGLFNPELMDHGKVRDLLMDCREFLQK